MKIILFLIFVSLSVALCFLFAYFWAVKDGQFEDDYTPSMRILIDDDMLQMEISEENLAKQNEQNLDDVEH